MSYDCIKCMYITTPMGNLFSWNWVQFNTKKKKSLLKIYFKKKIVYAIGQCHNPIINVVIVSQTNLIGDHFEKLFVLLCILSSLLANFSMQCIILLYWLEWLVVGFSILNTSIQSLINTSLRLRGIKQNKIKILVILFANFFFFCGFVEFVHWWWVLNWLNGVRLGMGFFLCLNDMEKCEYVY